MQTPNHGQISKGARTHVSSLANERSVACGDLYFSLQPSALNHRPCRRVAMRSRCSSEVWVGHGYM
jgi:hypothetical protein